MDTPRVSAVSAVSTSGVHGYLPAALMFWQAIDITGFCLLCSAENRRKASCCAQLSTAGRHLS